MKPQGIVLDNGGNTIKVGFYNQDEPRIIPNTIAKYAKGSTSTSADAGASKFVGDQLETNCRNFTSLMFKRPIEKGYLVDCNSETEIWARIFGQDLLDVEGRGGYRDTMLLVTEPLFNPPTLRRDLCDLVFEQFGFGEVCIASTAYLSMMNMAQEIPQKPNIFSQTKTALVVDSGFSFSHVVPILYGNKLMRQVRRVDMGGKAMSNYLKETISSRREFNVMDETYLVNDAKEKASFVSLDFLRDLRHARESNQFALRYVLPDYSTTFIGQLKPYDLPPAQDEQYVSLDIERFSVPELLFTPQDIGLDEAGIAETTVDAVMSDTTTSDEQKQLLFDSIVLVGGNTNIPNYKERFYNEVRKLVPSDFDVTVHLPNNPITCAWKGGCHVMQYLKQIAIAKPGPSEFSVTREEFLEHGLSVIDRKSGKL